MRRAGYRPVITRRATAESNEIGDYLARFSPRAAAKVVAQLLAAVDSLRRLPYRNRVHENRKSAALTVRSMVSRPYLIYYRVDSTNRSVRVLRILHGARRQPKRFR